jgi:glycosyltransferase involved in cell wall biosynthesis
MRGRSIAILVWGLRQGAFANVAAALSRVFCLGGARAVSVLYLQQGPGAGIHLPEEVELVRLGSKRALTSVPAITRHLSRARPDVIVTLSTLMAIPGIVGWRLSGARRQGTRLVIHQGDTLESDVRIDHPSDPRMRLTPFLAKILFPLADAMTATTPGVLELLRRDGTPIPKERVAVIPNPVDVESVRLRAAGRPQVAWLSDRGGPVLTSLGRLVPRKNFPLLLRALSRVRQQVDAKLVIFGEGPERPRLEGEITALGLGGAVSLPGFVENPFAEIAHSDLFVMPSLDEAFCLALVEAMACGVPVVATDAVGGGPRSILEGGEHGCLVPSGDEDTLAGAILGVLASPARRAELASEASRRADAFAPRAIAHRWAEFLEGLTDSGSEKAPSTRAGSRQVG